VIKILDATNFALTIVVQKELRWYWKEASFSVHCGRHPGEVKRSGRPVCSSRTTDSAPTYSSRGDYAGVFGVAAERKRPLRISQAGV
jgi:hypothetical protein